MNYPNEMKALKHIEMAKALTIARIAELNRKEQKKRDKTKLILARIETLCEKLKEE